MSSLYRCQVRVAYKPANSSRLIVFEERQIQELNVKLKWGNTFPTMASQGSSTMEAYASGISASTCQVTIADPYLTGAAWPTLFDAAAMYSASNTAITNNILLPPCGENEDPVRDKCYKYSSIDDTGLVGSDGSSRQATDTLPHLLVSMWYEVNGTYFGTDYYFRMSRIAVSHGSSYPSVTISGVEPKAVVFNQNLMNIKFDEGMTVEDALKKIAEETGFKANFCVPPNQESSKPYILPRALTYKGITPDEAMKKILGITGGSMLSLPIREQGMNVSVCSRAEIVQSCTVFYLGKGLYEGYEINGEPPVGFARLNSQTGNTINDADPYISASFSAEKYTLKEVIKSKRIKALEKVKKITFPGLFDNCDKRCQGNLSSGKVWKGSGPSVSEEVLSKVNFYGVAPNGETAISFLPGRVFDASEAQGTVAIKTNFWFQICKQDDSEKCFGRYIYQETTNLSSVDVKTGDIISVSQKIGSSTDEKKELTRFYIQGHDKSTLITIDPQLIWNWAAPEESVKDLKTGEGQPKSDQDNADAGSEGLYVGNVGSTGKSTGPHVHIQESTSNTLTESQLRDLAGKYVTVSGKSLTSYRQGEGFGAGRDHRGIDYPIEQGKPIRIFGKVVAAGTNVGGADCGNGVAFKPPEGPELLICHLQDRTIPPGLPGLSASGSSGKSNPTFANAPTNKALTIETSFKGVPRALRITPGRTVLSFISEYDSWIEAGKPSSIDPGVWIADRFRNWFVSEVDFVWRQGDLRVNIEANNSWGNTLISAPKFTEYLQGQTEAGEFEKTKDYYGYIRSVGDLCFPIRKSDGSIGNSCKEICTEAQEFYSKYGSSNAPSDDSSPGARNVFPVANCQYTGTKYPQDRVNAIINAAKSAGINTQAGFAGVVGNALVESGVGLSSTAENPKSKAYGVFQWLDGRRQGLERYASSKGLPASDFGVQMERFVQELNGADFQGRATVQALNSTGDPSFAAKEFNRLFERAPGQKETERQQYAREIFSELKCAK